jgi:hypothetical protein
MAQGYPFAIRRDDAYLKWRFVDHPTHKYHFIVMEQGAEPVGVAIVRLTDEAPPLGVVSDLIARPERSDITAALLGEALTFLRSRGACAALIDLSPAASGLLEGYRCALRQEFGMIVHTPDTDLEQAGIFSPDAWYQARSDSDEDY